MATKEDRKKKEKEDLDNQFHNACYDGKLELIKTLLDEFHTDYYPEFKVTLKHITAVCASSHEKLLEFFLTSNTITSTLNLSSEDLDNLLTKNLSRPTIVFTLTKFTKVIITSKIMDIVCEYGHMEAFKQLYRLRQGEVNVILTDEMVVKTVLRGYVDFFRGLNKIRPQTNHHLFHVSEYQQECKIYDEDKPPSSTDRKSSENNDKTPNKEKMGKRYSDGMYLFSVKELINVTNYINYEPNQDEDDDEKRVYYIYKARLLPDCKVETNETGRYWKASKFELYDEKPFLINTDEEWRVTYKEYYNRYFVMDPKDRSQRNWMRCEEDSEYQTFLLLQDGLLIEWIKAPTIDQCKIAINQSPYSIRFIPEEILADPGLQEFIKGHSSKARYFLNSDIKFTRYKELFHTKIPQ